MEEETNMDTMIRDDRFFKNLESMEAISGGITSLLKLSWTRLTHVNSL